MKCPECGRFMRKECESDDPENLELVGIPPYTTKIIVEEKQS